MIPQIMCVLLQYFTMHANFTDGETIQRVERQILVTTQVTKILKQLHLETPINQLQCSKSTNNHTKHDYK